MGPKTAAAIVTPWLSLGEAAEYTKRGRRWLSNQVKAGKCRAAVVGGRRELLFKTEFLDAMLEDLVTPVEANSRDRRRT